VTDDLGMYAEELIYSYEHPRNKGVMKDPDAQMHEENISCGDRITVYLKISGDRVEDVRFDGSGCVISMGTASMLTDFLRGKTLAEVEAFGKDRLLELISIDPGPVRIHCATLSLRAIRKAVLMREGKQIDRDTKEM
jgi:nitrogen fixation NifU-like protein